VIVDQAKQEEHLTEDVTPEMEISREDLDQSRTAATAATRLGARPNPTATVEQDAVSAFRRFAAEARVKAERARTEKAEADRTLKL
jgi:hypothetical protein